MNIILLLVSFALNLVNSFCANVTEIVLTFYTLCPQNGSHFHVW